MAPHNQTALWYEQYQINRVANRVRAMRLLREVRNARLTSANQFLDYLDTQIDEVLAEDARLTQELLDSTKRFIREPAHAPRKEAA